MKMHERTELINNTVGLVSIVLPIYNVENYLRQAIENIINQTYTNIEILLVNDGSTDNSLQIAKEYEKKDSRIVILEKDNGGLSSARNYGLKYATGQYIYFYDPDDIIDYDLIEKCINRIGNRYVDYVAFGHYMETEEGSILYKSELQNEEIVTTNTDQRFAFILDTLLKYEKMGWNAWSKLYNREFLCKYNLFFPDNRKIFAEDLAFMLQVALNQSRVLLIEQTMYHYVRHDESIMGRAKQEDIFHKIVLLALEFQNYAKTFKTNNRQLYISCINYSIIRLHLWQSCHSLKKIKNSILDFFDTSELIMIQQWITCINANICKLHKKLSLGAICETILLNDVISGKPSLPGKILTLILKMHDYYAEDLKCLIDSLSKHSGARNCDSQIYLLGTEDFGNLGDHEIAEAEMLFLKSKYKNVIEVTASQYFRRKRDLKRIINVHDILILTGGGNIGDMYDLSERIRRDVIKTWKKNFKIIFPQTVYYHDSRNREVLKDKYCFRDSYNVCLVAREKESYEFVKNNFACKAYMTPDIVLSIKAVQFKEINQRNGCLLLLRKDVEKSISNEDELYIEEIIHQKYGCIRRADTSKPYNIPASVRRVELDSLLKKIASSELVITDRLHGMVFCAITSTPCVVFENFNYKVRGTYEWIRDLPYIKLVQSIHDFENIIESNFYKQEYRYDETLLCEKYQILYDLIDRYYQ